MKKIILLVGICIFLICSTLTMSVAAVGPTVKLPEDFVTMYAQYASQSYFNIRLSNIDPGFDVKNTTYPGWCAQVIVQMTTKVNHTVKLYSSYDTNMPEAYKNGNWNKINYLLNHKKGDMMSIQEAIWYILCNDPTNDTDSLEMINDANQNGSTFIPTYNQQLAIVIEFYANYSTQIQRSFFELTLPQDSGGSGGSGSDPGTTPPPEKTNHPPTADGTAGEPYLVLHGQTIRFNGSRSYDSDGNIASYLWTFGDGTTSDEVVVNHTYANPGNYTVTLTVTDNDDATDTYTTYARSRLHLPPLAPTLTGSTKGSVGTSYQLRVVTSDPDNDMVRYLIDWGDGLQNATFLFPSNQNTLMTHRWNTWGYYTIQVYAEDQFNLTSEISRIIVAVDVQYVGDQGYLIDTDSNGQFDAFFSNSTGLQTAAQRQQTGIYLIDRNGDGDFDYQYDPSTSTHREYPEALSPSYTMLLVGVVIVIIVLLLIGLLMKRRTKPKQ